ncbi:AMP-binding protein [Streptomyces europaeiscabiei]|uniref:AMP-binding protein n=1 Tax=Streptomyces europaeiscabiei TaxID=146819 RepID=UPI002E0FC686|nr:AMP-binding protein [Streptomyces europaeiscabiei]
MDPLSLPADDRVAVVGADGSRLTYRELVRRADGLGPSLPQDRKGLVALFGDRDLGTLIAYVAALRHGHAVAWFGSVTGTARQQELVRRFRPDVVVAPGGELAELLTGFPYRPLEQQAAGVHVARRTDGTTLEVHEDTSVLLLTSGTMGSGRAVRLSGAAVVSNSRGIIDALSVRSTGRAATSIPLYHAYGLSVLNSHLIAGASVLLTETPASGVRFWKEFAAAECTAFAAVPFHIQWLVRSRLAWDRVPTLAAVTVSGARTPEAVAQACHQRVDAAGFRFYKMYGQTEATSRISVLAHEEFADHPDSVGRVIAGSAVVVTDESGVVQPDGVSGRIVYRGPNAMQGYAADAAALAAPDLMRGVVDTGDSGFLSDGYLYVEGRLGRFVKPNGKRLELDLVERRFEELAPAAAVGTDDEKAHLFIEGRQTSVIQELRLDIVTRAGIGPDALQIHFLDSIPRKKSGKVDYGTLKQLAAGSL